jgi:hypothetical protein
MAVLRKGVLREPLVSGVFTITQPGGTVKRRPGGGIPREEAAGKSKR